ncbi:DNA polymerase III subunit beta [bacterium]|nr:DNA polymerase III subunit beta [bacterium]
MQFSCNQDTFAKYLNVVSRVVNSKPGLPILSNILIEVQKGKLVMTATDLEIGINTWIGIESKSEGAVTVPAKQISEFVNSIPSEKVDVVLDKQVLDVSTVNNSAQFHTIPADDYPKVATAGGGKPVLKLNKEDLLLSINRVAFAAASDDVKPVLTGIKIELEGKTASFVAADGLRLSKQSIKLSSEVKENSHFLVPVKAMQELAFVLTEFAGQDGKDDVEVYVIEDRNQVLFRYNDVDIISRLIDGQYPDYKQILPSVFKTQVQLSTSEFTNSLKVTNIIARSVLGNKIIVEIDPKGSNVVMSATLSDVGSNKSVVAGKVEGDAIKMAFSSKFLSDMANNIGAEEIVFESSEPVKPGVFKIKGDDTFVHLIMPMML